MTASRLLNSLPSHLKISKAVHGAKVLILKKDVCGQVNLDIGYFDSGLYVREKFGGV